MLQFSLYAGSRLTNFVGILSQGLRIAPPEAPATGYMVLFHFLYCTSLSTGHTHFFRKINICNTFEFQFGKGVYFADLVSKSAQYCFTDRKNPVGLVLLSEVALGEVYELTKAKVSAPSMPMCRCRTRHLFIFFLCFSSFLFSI